MKKVIYIFVALLAFACGVFVFYIRPLYVTIPFYELKENLEKYNSHKIKVSGFFIPNRDELSESYGFEDYLPNCISDEPFDCNTFGILELSDEVKEQEKSLIKEITDKNYQLGKTDFRQGEYGVEVEVVGYVEEKRSNFGIYTAIRVMKMKQISAVRFRTTDELRNYE